MKIRFGRMYSWKCSRDTISCKLRPARCAVHIFLRDGKPVGCVDAFTTGVEWTNELIASFWEVISRITGKGLVSGASENGE
jgi:hypothetical protein